MKASTTDKITNCSSYIVRALTSYEIITMAFVVQIEDRKEELHRKVILMSNLTIKDQFKDAVGIVSEWNWSVSGGPKFFEVDRPLLSGVMRENNVN
jgi:hypothetical protein